MDAVFSAGLLLGSAVNLDELNVRVGGLELLSSLSIFRGEFLAVTTPWGVELTEDEVVLIESFLEVFVTEDKDTFFSWVFTGEDGGDAEESEDSDFH